MGNCTYLIVFFVHIFGQGVVWSYLIFAEYYLNELEEEKGPTGFLILFSVIVGMIFSFYLSSLISSKKLTIHQSVFYIYLLLLLSSILYFLFFA